MDNDWMRSTVVGSDRSNGSDEVIGQQAEGTFMLSAAPSHEAGAWCTVRRWKEGRNGAEVGGVGLRDAIKRAGEMMASWRIIAAWWHIPCGRAGERARRAR